MKRLPLILTLIYISFDTSGQASETQKEKYRDNSVSKIFLRDPKSVEWFFGKNQNHLDATDDMTDVASVDGRQILTMIFHPGGTINEFYEFKVSYNTAKLKPSLIYDTKHFITGKKIKHGQTEKQVERILGTPTQSTTDNGIKIWRYKRENDNYFGRYDFKDGRLIQFWFGDEYP